MFILYVGGVGSGKTLALVHDAITDAGDFIYSNFDIDVEGVKASDDPDGDDKKLVRWKSFDDETVRDAKCGALLIDEAPLWLDARKWETLNPEARRKLLEHRKDDLIIIGTSQHISFIDKIFRLMTDEIRLVKICSLPFIGWIWPKCVRPTQWCEHCGRVRRDGHGDDIGLRRVFGFGSYIKWETYAGADLERLQATSGEDERPEPLRTGRRLFDIEVARRYSTVDKLSGCAAAAASAARSRHGGGGGFWPKTRRYTAPTSRQATKKNATLDGTSDGRYNGSEAPRDEAPTLLTAIDERRGNP